MPLRLSGISCDTAAALDLSGAATTPGQRPLDDYAYFWSRLSANGGIVAESGQWSAHDCSRQKLCARIFDAQEVSLVDGRYPDHWR